MSKAAFDDLTVRRQRAAEEAAAWLIRLHEEAPDSSARGAYTDWLRESPLHVAAMLSVSQTCSALAAFDCWNDIPKESGPFNDTVVEWAPPVEIRDGTRPAPKKHALRVKRFAVAAAAASMLVAVGGALWWEGLVGGAVFRTAAAERRNLALQDGSTVVLGPQTRVRVTFSRAKRDVRLERGEAVFKVAHDPGRPFIVTADRARVRAVGTEFGVERREDTVVVTVAEGRVAVSQSAPSALSMSDRPASAPPVALGAGEQVSIPHAGASSTVQKVDSADSLAWANGRLVFNNDTVSFVVERFNQYNRLRLTVTDPRLAGRRISGSFDASDPESLLKFLRASLPLTITSTAEGREIALETRPRHDESLDH